MLTFSIVHFVRVISFRQLALSFMLLSGLSACASSDYAIVPDRLMLGNGAQTAGQTVTVKPKDVLMESGLGYRNAIELSEEVSIEVAGKSTIFPGKTLLEKATILGDVSTFLPKDTAFFCADNNWNGVNAVLGVMTLGLGSLASRTSSNTRFCMADSDNNMTLDHVILIGAKREADRVPLQIEDIPYQTKINVPMATESYARIRYLGKIGLRGRLGFELTLIENGKALQFTNKRVIAKPDELPEELRQLGARFTVLAFNEETEEATIRIGRPIPAGTYGIHTYTTTRYVPIFY